MGFAELLNKISSITERVNAGQCKEFVKAEFMIAYPATWYFIGADGSQIAIYALDAITDTGNGYRIDYREHDTDGGAELFKTLCIDFQ